MYTRFFMSNTFISNGRLKFGKSQSKAKQHHEAEHLTHMNKKPAVLVSKRSYD